jgi:hypothetical protein
MENFESLNLPLPESLQMYSIEQQKEIFEYLSSLNECHIIAYKIAFNHLGTSYNILRTNGFKEWKMKNGK